jgi:hypothetical protein
MGNMKKVGHFNILRDRQVRKSFFSKLCSSGLWYWLHGVIAQEYHRYISDWVSLEVKRNSKWKECINNACAFKINEREVLRKS